MKGLKGLKLFTYLTNYLAVALNNLIPGSQLFMPQLQVSNKYTSKY